MNNNNVATLAGGCFWCIEAVFEQVDGVDIIESGYTGGHTLNPSYEEVCAGITGHAEAVRLSFDVGVITYREILEIFFSIHDPTTLNRQEPDVGDQYRSEIFVHNADQRDIADAVINELSVSQLWGSPIVTKITESTEFFIAEPYHQQFYRNNGYQPYCQIIINPKLDKFRRQYPAKIKVPDQINQ